MSVCIQYSKPSSGRDDTEIYGFDVAVINLMKAYFRHSQETQFLCRPTDLESFDHFKAMASLEGHDADKKCVGLDPRHPETTLGGISCVFRPDPLTVDLMWRRQQVSGRPYVTCGLVHTMSGERIARAVGDLCSAPSDHTDALICPSTSIKEAVKALWEIRCDYFNHRFGCNFSCPVQLPVIPLGIETQKFVHLTSAEKRKEQRSILEIEEDEVVVLFLGRLSFATKAHPFPLFAATERAAIRTKKKVRLLMFGYFKPKDMESHFRALAQDMCKTIRIDFILNDDHRFPDGLWAAADIFCSLSDNNQESFGLTPIEAMACGLPAVVSDWDGYREGVRNGVDGFLVPVLTPPPSAGMAIAKAYYNQENYGVSLAAAAQSTSVDIEYCTHAFAVLFDDENLRRSLGASGRMRAQNIFDWKYVIAAYEALWQDLSERRLSSSYKPEIPLKWQAYHPAFPNPYHMFKSFPSTHIEKSDILHIGMSTADVEGILKHEMNYFVPDLLLPKEQIRELIDVLRRAQAASVQNILDKFPEDRHDLLWRCFGWMAKFGICIIERPRS